MARRIAAALARIVAPVMAFMLLAPGSAIAQSAGAPRDTPGRFDYYMLVLSWSPQYCATARNAARDKQQCLVRRYGFIAHGLWPQYLRGYPRECPTSEKFDLSRADIERLLPVMPSDGLIRHQWRAHGTCSGLSAKDYFARTEQAYQSIKIPVDYANPGADVVTSASQLRQRFAANNPGLPIAAIVPMCDGQYLQEVRVCLTRDLRPRACTVEIRTDCRQDRLILRPMR